MADPSKKDCSTCRYASTHQRPKIMAETGFDDQLMFEDTDETVYTCRAFYQASDPDAFVGGTPRCAHAGKEVGVTPITCEAYAEPVRRDLSALDKMIAEREARAAARDKG